ncbi:MAG: PHP domain protein, partial [Microgenomates group bacterium GW2011_GWC2_45_8]
MIEADILPDGALSIPEEGTKYLDAMIVSIHSSFGMPKDAMTKRILKGLSHPKARILAHPTGR